MQPLHRGCRGPAKQLLCVLTALVAALLVAAPAAAVATGTGPGNQPGWITSPAPGEVLQGGQLVTIAWQEVAADAEELELLLLLDGHEGSALRLTRQLSPRRRTFPWRVPNLPRTRVRLQIRYGRGGVELPCQPSLPFLVTESLTEPLSPIVFQAGEWWLGKGPGINGSCACGSGSEAQLSAYAFNQVVAVLPIGEGPVTTLSPAFGEGAGPGTLLRSPRPHATSLLTRQPMDMPLRP